MGYVPSLRDYYMAGNLFMFNKGVSNGLHVMVETSEFVPSTDKIVFILWYKDGGPKIWVSKVMIIFHLKAVMN